MARANLNISADIDEAFVKAQETRTVRILTVKIQAEELVLAGSIEKLSNNAHEDFDSILIESLADDQAAFVLFCLDDDPSSVAADSALSWCMITWIPDSCKVRDKMLYSSSREDLKRHMGIGYFKTEYAANYKTDISWQQYKQSLSKDVNSDMLTESERLVQEEKVMAQAESAATKSTALGVMPFEMSAEVTEKLADLSRSTGAAEEGDPCNWVEMTVVSEKIELVAARLVCAGDSLQDFISTDKASFIALRLPKLAGGGGGGGGGGENVTLFVFSCPEATPVRLKMTMSSSKASVLAAAQLQGLAFDKTLEIRDADEIDEQVRAEIDPQASGGSAAAGGVSSAAANLSHSKPSRPGRGKAKVSKFKLDSADA